MNQSGQLTLIKHKILIMPPIKKRPSATLAQQKGIYRGPKPIRIEPERTDIALCNGVNSCIACGGSNRASNGNACYPCSVREAEAKESGKG